MDNLTAGSERARWMLLLAQHRAHLLTAFAGMTEEQLNTVSDETGWTLADVLAHVNVWEQRVSGLLPAILAGDTPDVPNAHADALNQRATAGPHARHAKITIGASRLTGNGWHGKTGAEAYTD